MKRLLLITADDTVVDDLQNLLDSLPVTLDRAADWNEGRDRLIEQTYSATIVDADALDVSQPRAFVQLNDLLTKESTRALLVARGDGDQLAQYTDHLDGFVAPLDVALIRDGKGTQRLRDLVDAARSLENRRSDAGLEVDSDRSTDRLTGPVHGQLPPLESGSLGDVHFARLLHAAAVHDASGELVVSTGQMTRRIALRDGDILDAVDEGLAGLDQIPPIFAWSSGNYSFESKLLEGAGLTEVIDVVIRGVFNHMSERGLMNDLMGLMDRYAARVERFTSSIPDRRRADIASFLEIIDGETTLESVLSTLRSDSRRGFQAAYVAIHTDRVVLADQPLVSPISLLYGHESDDATDPSDASDGLRDESSVTQLEASSSSTRPDDRNRVDLDKLDELLARAEDATPHEIIGVWEGCGTSIVRDRFIPLVKRFHPDRYGQSLTDEQHETAQDLFMRIQEAREELIRSESEQTEPEPTPEPTSLLLAGKGARQRPTDRPEEPAVSGPGTNPNESGVIGLGGRSDVDDFARQMGHRESSPGESDDDANTTNPPRGMAETRPPPGSPSDDNHDRDSADTAGLSTESSSTDDGEAIAMGAGPENDSGPRAAERETEKLDLGDDSDITLETESTGDASHDAGDDDGGSREPRETDNAEKVRRLRKNTSTANLAGGSSSNSSPRQTSRPSLGSKPTTEKQAKQHFNFGYKALKAQKEETALKHLKLAHDFDSDNGLFKTFYGYALFQSQPDMRDEAQELLEEAIELEHEQALPDAHLFLGRILRVKDDHAKAKRHFKMSLSLNPDSKAAQRELRLYEIRDKKGGLSEQSSDDEGDDVSFKDDPAGYLKNLFNKDLF